MDLPALVDSHCHLAFEAFAPDREAVIERARGAGVVACVAVAVDAASARAARDLARRHPGWAHPTAGVHPTEEAVADPAATDAVAGLLSGGGFVAVGETGLDAYHQRTRLDDQRVAFERHLRLAADLDMPVVIHCRDAFDLMHEVLAGWRGVPLRGVLHCFTGRRDDARRLVDAGLHIGAGGIATFRPRDDLREALRAVPDERLLVETDAPWLAPVPVRGRRNEPAFVAHVARCLAADRGVGLERFAERTTASARALFGLADEAVPPA